MKSLHKKIGAMVLASGLLLGVGGLSNASFVHASSSFRGLMAKIPDSYNDKRDDIGEIISRNGGMFNVIDILRPGMKLSGKEYFSGYSEMEIDSGFILKLREAIKRGGAEELGLKRGCYYGLNFYGLKIIIKVF